VGWDTPFYVKLILAQPYPRFEHPEHPRGHSIAGHRITLLDFHIIAQWISRFPPTAIPIIAAESLDLIDIKLGVR